MNIKHSYDFVKQFLLEKSIELLSKDYRNNHSKLECKCVKCNYLWSATFCCINNHNTGCPKCVGKAKPTQQEVVDLLKLRNYITTDIYINARTLMNFHCKICQCDWKTSYGNISQGHGCPLCGQKLKHNIEEIKQFLFERNIELLSKKYKNNRQKLECKCNICNNVWSANFGSLKNMNTGCPICAQLKIAKSSNNSTILYHWKTGEELVCQASYEPKVVEYLNKNKIDFDWQIKFDMSNGKRYFVDLYLKEYDKYVEIKGYFRKDAEEKWNWFHSEYPNSELWNKEKLKEMRIL